MVLSFIKQVPVGCAAASIVLSALSWLPCCRVCADSLITPQQLQQTLEPLAAGHAGEVAVSVQVLDAAGKTSLQWDLHGDRVMPTASLIKLPLMIEAYRQAEAGRVSLDVLLTLQAEDKVPGSGILTEHFSAGSQLSLRDAVRLMIRYSDNTATNLVIDQVGIAATAQTMSAWGFPETQLHSQVFRRETSVALERSERYGLGSTTANDMTELLARLERGELVSSEASRQMLEHLFTCDDTKKLARQLPSDCRVAHKTGSVSRSRTAAGIISTNQIKFAICVLTDKNDDSRWTDDNAADVLIGSMARSVYDLLMQSLPDQETSEAAVASSSNSLPAEATATTAPTLKSGAVGDLIETLQRTLNARIDAKLSVDGDFGSATEQAVRSFQQRQQLTIDGIVEQKTWHALQPLVERDPPVPPPAEINTREFPKSVALDPQAPPAVSAKAWAVLDVASGQVLSHGNGDARVPMASTTKVMTALLVLELAAADPSVLNEVITFTARADQTIGSTAGVRAGEQVTTGELLYGLLLPSGNDASVALAEHFGSRLAAGPANVQKTDTQKTDAQTSNGSATAAQTSDGATAESPAAPDGYAQFIVAMNVRAAELGLSQTHFANPNGLPDSEHFSSAHDLARLALAALHYPLMREIMQCRQRGVQVRTRDGHARNLLWENTNRLLQQAGFGGMKTGTTDAAGACLIAVGSPAEAASNSLDQSDGPSQTQAQSPVVRQTIVVVLGCSSSDARYMDARNLFAWAWRQ